MIPIHRGTQFPIHLGLTGRPRFVDVPPLEVLMALTEKLPRALVEILRPGESLDL